MLPHTSSYEGAGQRKNNSDIRTAATNADKKKVPNLDNDKRKQQSFDYDFQKPQKKYKLSISTSKKAKGPTRQPYVPYNSIPINMRNATSKKAKGPTRQPYVPYNSIPINMRNTPIDLFGVLKRLSDAQISAITDMGFQSILSMNIRYIPTSLGYWLLVNYDHKTNELNVGRRRIKITPSKVHEVFGIPMGRITITEKNNPRQGAHPTVDQFRRQFDHEKISVKDVITKLNANRSGGPCFKLNFLVIFNTILGKTTTGATVNQKFLSSIVDYSDICNMDWCSYMITCLNRTKETWNVKDKYNGPLTLLAVLYAHEYELRHRKIQEPVKTPAISYISTKHLFDMEKFVHVNGQLTYVDITNSRDGPRIKSCSEPQRKSSNEDVGEVQIQSPNEVCGVQTEGQNAVESTCAKTINSYESEREDECENQDEGECGDDYENQDQSAYEYQDQGDNFQSKEDQCETQDEEENHATDSKHHGLNQQIPIGTNVKRVVDDCITPPSLQSLSGMLAFLDRSSVPTPPVDASLLDHDGDVELLDPKQDHSELDGNVSHMSDSLEKVSSPQSGKFCVRGYKVKQSTATILEAIFKKHGDIAANCIFKTSSIRAYFLEVVCEAVRQIQTNDAIDKMEDIECQVSDAEAANINVSWIRAHFEAFHKWKVASTNYSLLMDMKVNTNLVKRAAQMDLRERSVELVAAQQRFQKAERCVRVLHLVEKNLNDRILESKAKVDSWVKQPVL